MGSITATIIAEFGETRNCRYDFPVVKCRYFRQDWLTSVRAAVRGNQRENEGVQIWTIIADSHNNQPPISVSQK
jgi:hypothetical protein